MNNLEKTLLVYTADDESPNCMKCDNICGPQEKCDKCGPKYWWHYYKRTELVGENEEDE